ncbi:MAG: hypothetical protein K6E85_03070 [Lachnospiraceae bacterium]|nr:hypothetical protein [Lachnospiraceae bacterium]
MIKVFKTDLFRLFRSRSFYAFPIFVTVIMLLQLMLSGVVVEVEESDTAGDSGIVAVDYTVSDTDDDGELQTNDTDSSAAPQTDSSDTIGAYAASEVNDTTAAQSNDTATGRKYTEIGIITLLETLSDGTLLLFMGIVLVIFATNESKNGFVKTAAGCVADKGYMPVSKIATGLVITVIYTLEFAVIKLIFTALAAAINDKPLKYVSIPEGDVGKYAAFILLCVLVHVAFAVLLMLLHELLRSRAVGIVWIFIESAGLFANLVASFFSMLQSWFKILPGFNITKYLLMSNLNGGYASEAYDPAIVLVMSLIYLGCGAAAAVWMAKHKDVR